MTDYRTRSNDHTNFVYFKLIAMVPQPVKAVVLLFPITEAYEVKKKEEDRESDAGKLPPVDPTVIWVKQTASLA